MESSSYISTNSKIIIYFKIVNKNYRFEIILNNFYKEYMKNIDVFKIENTPFEKCRFVKHLVQREIQRKQQVFLSGRARQGGA